MNEGFGGWKDRKIYHEKSMADGIPDSELQVPPDFPCYCVAESGKQGESEGSYLNIIVMKSIAFLLEPSLVTYYVIVSHE